MGLDRWEALLRASGFHYDFDRMIPCIRFDDFRLACRCLFMYGHSSFFFHFSHDVSGGDTSGITSEVCDTYTLCWHATFEPDFRFWSGLWLGCLLGRVSSFVYLVSFFFIA